MNTLRRAPLLAAFATALLAGCGGSDPTRASTEAALEPVAAQQRVRTVVIQKAPLDAAHTASGIVRAFHKADVTAETAGRVLARKVERGQRVEAGDVLLELDPTRLALELRRAQATLKARGNDLAHARREFERGERLVKSNAISAQRRDDLRHGLDRARDDHSLAEVTRDTAQRNLADAQIRAPFDARVDDLHVDIGDYVTPGAPVAVLVELSRARVFAGVTAQEAARLEPGSTAHVRFSSLGGVEAEATLRAVATVASERDGTYEVELWIDAPPPGIRDGMVTSSQLESSNVDALPLAPRAGLLRRAGRVEIFVVEQANGRNVATLRALRTRRSAGEWIEVLDGLAEGDRVIVEGQFALRDGIEVVLDDSPLAAAN